MHLGDAEHRRDPRPPRGHRPSSTLAHKRLVAAAYDRSAAAYAATADPHVYRRLTRPMVEALGRLDGPVLDAASGPGAAGRRFADVVALDLSIGQLLQNPTRDRVRADGERLPFRDGAFAAAVCQFGLNHFPDPEAAVREMARVAPVVGVTTWARPETPYAPKQAVLDVIARHGGLPRTTTGALVESLGNRVGSVPSIASLLRVARMVPSVEKVTVVVPWPGIDSFLDYRLAMPSTAGLAVDAEALRRDAAAAITALPERELDWPVRLIVGIGRRRSREPDVEGVRRRWP